MGYYTTSSYNFQTKYGQKTWKKTSEQIPEGLGKAKQKNTIIYIPFKQSFL